MKKTRWCSASVMAVLLLPAGVEGQTARVSEEVRSLPTYPFSEPNPVPIIGRDPRLYPYHSFDGYSTTSEPRDWKIVRLENDLIEVFVLPEVGGKVWGAVVKETGHEFIYRNEVMKFRNIALRGPWTSGGIEFNFGVVGHTPATATPVDYVLRENPDGSVSCIVGGMDLPSRTHWRVEIRLPADRAYFETNVLWYNPTPLEQPYYNWMTAAAFAQDDLEMSIPGSSFLEHPGGQRPWPEDEVGRYLPEYDANRFGGNKSYHVVGEFNDFFGGYYRDDDYGFGHWARYEDMPGQKLWLWALSRAGGIWEDLLTDTDGQYVEYQAGRLLVQYTPTGEVNPITQAGFEPMSASRWSERWFPLEGIGGLTDASKEGAMFVRLAGPEVAIGINAFGDVEDTLEVWSGDRRVERRLVRLEALQPYRTSVRVRPGEDVRVRLLALGLDYETNPETRRLGRPFATDPGAMPSIPAVDRKIAEAHELLEGRRYAQASELFAEALAEEPWNRSALLGSADLAQRRGDWTLAGEQLGRLLQLDAYDADANFMAGVVYRAVGAINDARDAFGWAARSMAYRSAANAQLSEIAATAGQVGEAARYARLAIDYDRRSVPAWRTLAVLARLTGDADLATEALGELLALDPLHHFVWAERFLAQPSSAHRAELAERLGGEYPEQTALELATDYYRRGLVEDAAAVLAVASSSVDGVMVDLWRAHLHRNPTLLPASPDIAFAFPFRVESIGVLEWARERSEDWEWSYLHALALWGVGRGDEGAAIMDSLGEGPDQAAFYAARAALRTDRRQSPIDDLRRAVAMDPARRVYHVLLVEQLQSTSQWLAALDATREGRRLFSEDFNLQLLEARGLIQIGRHADAADILDRVEVLPSEHARESHLLYEVAHLGAALSEIEGGLLEQARLHVLAALEWPESLGQGRPYEPEERAGRLLLGHLEARLGNDVAANAAFEAVVNATSPEVRRGEAAGTAFDRTAVFALRALGRADDAESMSPSVGAGVEGMTPPDESSLQLRSLIEVLRAVEGMER